MAKREARMSLITRYYSPETASRCLNSRLKMQHLKFNVDCKYLFDIRHATGCEFLVSVKESGLK